jgi:hypothetical protein
MRLTPCFFSNLADDNHCLQASVLSVLNSLGHKIGWDEVNRETQYEDGLYTWVSQGALTISKYVKGATIETVFDYDKFAKEGEVYLSNQWSPAKLEIQRRLSSPGFAKEQESARKVVEGGLYNRITEFDRNEFVGDLGRNLIIAIIDAPKLYNKTGTSFHLVVVYGASNAGKWYFLHDPGLPARPSERVEAEAFWKSFTGEIILVPHGSVPFGTSLNANGPCYCGSGRRFKQCHGDQGQG